MKRKLLVRFLPILAAAVQVQAQDPSPTANMTYKRVINTGSVVQHYELTPIIVSSHTNGAVVPGGASGKRSVAIFRP